MAEVIPSHGASDLSITFQLANELRDRGSSWSEQLQSQAGRAEAGRRRAEPAGTSTSAHTPMKLTGYNIITIKRPITAFILRWKQLRDAEDIICSNIKSQIHIKQQVCRWR